MNALNKGIGFLIAGILLPYIGVRVTGGFLLGNGEVPSFVAMQVASSLALLLSVGLYFLSNLEKAYSLKILCLIVAIAYAATGIYLLLSSNSSNIFHLIELNLFLKVSVGVLAGILIMRNVSYVDKGI